MTRMADNLTPRRGATQRRRGLVLPIMLLILLLLGLLVSTFAFQTQADYLASRSKGERLQCRLAAEAGVQRVMVMLRTERDNVDTWFNNQPEFDQILLWRDGVQPQDEVAAPPQDVEEDREYGYRFSIVRDDPAIDDEPTLQFGIIDESAKLNINTATEDELQTLLLQVIPTDLEDDDPTARARQLAQALIDWRDTDTTPMEFGAEDEYYATLPTPYRAKNAPFETPEELLMVRGFDGRILYGEDFDRNGLLTPNEDDSDLTFPPDNADGILNRGLLPYITVWSSEYNVAIDNTPRLYLFGDKAALEPKLQEIFEDQATVDFLLKASKNEGTNRIYSLADLMVPREIENSLYQSPFSGPAAHDLFDHCTLRADPKFVGLINVNTAPATVLRTLDLTEEQIALLIQKRAALDSKAKRTVAWLLLEKVVDNSTFYRIAHRITARGRQFSVESIGFADHHGLFSRLQVVLDMRGPLSQVVYYRDLTSLGLGFPIRGQEGERRFALEANDTSDSGA